MTFTPEQLTPREDKLEFLKDDFCSLFEESKKDEVEKLFQEIIPEYQNESRFYHDLNHIDDMLSYLELNRKKIKDLDSLKIAVWFHDVVYDTQKNDNEEQSALKAKKNLESLELSDELIEKIISLIRATAKHEPIENSPDSLIFLDADLAVLGSHQEEYDDYAAKIRQEYSWVPDDEYKSGRIKVLRNFLERISIYFTEESMNNLEKQARKNIQREIQRLS